MASSLSDSRSLFVLTTLLPASLPVSALSTLSETSHSLRAACTPRLFSDLILSSPSLSQAHARLVSALDRAGTLLSPARLGQVRRLEWSLEGSGACDADDDEDAFLSGTGEGEALQVCETLGHLIALFPKLQTVSLTSHSFWPFLSLEPVFSTSPPCLDHLRSLSLSGFTVPPARLSSILSTAVNLRELSLQTFDPISPEDLEFAEPRPSDLHPLSLGVSRTHALHSFSGLASNLRPLLTGPSPPSLRSIALEALPTTRPSDILAALDMLPVRTGSAGLCELKIVNLEDAARAEWEQGFVADLCQVLRTKGGLTSLSIGFSETLAEEGHAEKLMTAIVPSLSLLPTLEVITITTPSPLSALSSSESPGPDRLPSHPLPLQALASALPALLTLTLNSTLWRFLRPEVLSAKQSVLLLAPPVQGKGQQGRRPAGPSRAGSYSVKLSCHGSDSEEGDSE